MMRAIGQLTIVLFLLFRKLIGNRMASVTAVYPRCMRHRPKHEGKNYK